MYTYLYIYIIYILYYYPRYPHDQPLLFSEGKQQRLIVGRARCHPVNPVFSKYKLCILCNKDVISNIRVTRNYLYIQLIVTTPIEHRITYRLRIVNDKQWYTRVRRHFR